MTTATGGLIYGIRLKREFEYRYVGLTTKPSGRRLSQHLKAARDGRKTPFYDWLRNQDPDAVVLDELDWVEGLEALGQAEIAWIAYLREEGDRLLNISAGGVGPTAVEWTPEQREAARLRSLGRPGLSRPGRLNPFFGKSHSDAQKAEWSRIRRGRNQGEKNPNFGKFGADHPGFGRTMSDEAKVKLSRDRSGPGNPNFGKIASAETRAKMSAVRKGQPRPASRRSAHTRHHTNKGVRKDSCQYCVEDLEQQKYSDGDDS
ncbi:NUMOD3 domain-containing DNA-binding protein [Arthrobacter sp. NPDC090010]|uniref:NUMOD3 domain-containing DNA-binding protein n=1 Tax=Arthrobacter sp. NPDC090010 TaxID=3363942 RepID=UPI00381A7434